MSTYFIARLLTSLNFKTFENAFVADVSLKTSCYAMFHTLNNIFSSATNFLMDKEIKKMVRNVLVQLQNNNTDFRRNMWFYVFVELLGQKELDPKVRTKKLNDIVVEKNMLSAEFCSADHQQDT